MKINKVIVYRVVVPLGGRYAWSNDLFVEESDATVVEIVTDEGISGFAEITPLGPAYMPAYAEGARTGLQKLAPSLIGLNPCDIGVVNRVMDLALAGHPYVKSPIDIACWDILGQASGRPVWQLLGGRMQESMRSFMAVSQSDAGTMAEAIMELKRQGFSRFQLKVGGSVEDDIKRIQACHDALGDEDLLYADANTGWTIAEAVRVVNAIGDLRKVFVEQPCRSYEECLAVRRRTHLPFILDESIDTIQAMMRAISDQACDAINLKVSRVGGISKARQIRDLCVSSGVAVNIDEALSGNINSAVLSHLAASISEDALLTTVIVSDELPVSLVEGSPTFKDGRIFPSDRPGLGITPNREVLGEPIFVIG